MSKPNDTSNVVRSQARLLALKTTLLKTESECSLALEQVIRDLDRNYTELVHNNRQHLNTFFTVVSGAYPKCSVHLHAGGT